ncbi:hypothetical protein HYR69_11790 [Candidatus Sumerlaeota bacterium]|nr:hypothetical protein [Candidatus Sumerlaeota bacterium]
MPMFTYTPKWDRVRAFYEKFRPYLPPEYTGLLGIRLHRTGFPLSVELFGKSLPDKPLFPMVLLELNGGKITRSWGDIEEKFDVPWARESDHHAMRDDIMKFYHAEDLLEARAEQILLSDPPDEALIKKSLFDHAYVLA